MTSDTRNTPLGTRQACRPPIRLIETHHEEEGKVTQITYADDQKAINVARTIGVLAVIAALTAVVAGLVLLIADLNSGSTFEATLGITAAVAGLSTAGLVITGPINAQEKNLWKYASDRDRTTAWALIALDAIVSLVRSIAS